MNIGFIGLGIMGAPMALHLVEAGHQLFVNTVGPIPDSISGSSSVTVCPAFGMTQRQLRSPSRASAMPTMAAQRPPSTKASSSGMPGMRATKLNAA